MTTYTNIFNGNTVSPAYPSFNQITLTGNSALVWTGTNLSNSTNTAAAIIEVDSDNAANELSLPDATLVSVGQVIIFNNIGANAFELTDYAGGSIVVIAAGAEYIVYLRNNSTQAGSWNVSQLATGTSGAVASALAGNGLIALSNLLNLNIPIDLVSVNTVLTSSNRANFIVWNGGTGDISLPNPTTVTDGYLVAINNQTPSAGQLNIDVVGGATIDGLASFPLFSGNSAIFVTDGVNYYTIGNGRNVITNITALKETIQPGTTVLNLTQEQAKNQIQIYNGALTTNVQINVPGTGANYYVYNNTTGSFTLTMGSTVGGNTFEVPQGGRNIFWHDGTTNIYDAVTTISTSLLTWADIQGTSPNLEPSIRFTNDENAGFGRLSTGEVSIVHGGQNRYIQTSATSQFLTKIQNIDGSSALPAYSFTSAGNYGMYLDGTNLKFSVNGNDLLTLTATSITGTQAFYAINGSSGTPSYSFTNSTDSGFSYNGSSLLITFSGVNIITLNGSQVLSSVPVISDTIQAGQDGSAGSVYIYPSATNKGRVLISHAGNTGNTTTTISILEQANPRTYSVPDAGTSASFVMNEGNQTIDGTKTFSDLVSSANFTLPGDITFSTTSGGLIFTTGPNARYGTGTLVAGTAVVANSSVTANSFIILKRTNINASSSLGILEVSAISAGANFTVTAYAPASAATEIADVSSFEYLIVEHT